MYTGSMNPPKVIAVVGMTGSGKGTLVDYLTETLHAPKVYFGGMVYEEVEKRGLDIVSDERMVREDMRAKEGPAVLAKRAAARAQELLASGEKIVILDGVYSWSEDKYLRETFGTDYVSIAVVGSKTLRYQRVVERNDSHRQYTLEQAAERDIQEIEGIEKGGPIAYADYYILNDDSYETFYADADRLRDALEL